ncbi:hypothetical protein JQ604_12135 [Bradyrhizobium jicamae]|uniref:primase-like DNA-binding domain-containing protein n=1 Tax=Bradyrhizobium jicamae TaxID=280332 RepID=UPI001BA4B7AB|nr:primase-like DNA-binding domain-containing protein [Bradyrhizobium jicamae]MBR0752935.1 hypothetical protein [Bradyrhizobium jicamae]
MAWQSAGVGARKAFLDEIFSPAVCSPAPPRREGGGSKLPSSTNDSLTQFLEACIAESHSGRVQSSVLHLAFDRWCNENHRVSTLTNKRLTMEMERRGFKKHVSNVVWWVGIELTVSGQNLAHGTR